MQIRKILVLFITLLVWANNFYNIVPGDLVDSVAAGLDVGGDNVDNLSEALRYFDVQVGRCERRNDCHDEVTQVGY